MYQPRPDRRLLPPLLVAALLATCLTPHCRPGLPGCPPEESPDGVWLGGLDALQQGLLPIAEQHIIGVLAEGGVRLRISALCCCGLVLLRR